jgi:diguanylate cyclase (GGDEF)-like protein
MVALCFLDLNDFKPVNDQHGHAAGDLLLIEVARRLQDCVRPHDTVCRMGGDEFVLLMTNLVNEQESEVIVARAAEQLQQPFIIPGVQAPVQLSFSAGLALYPEDAQDAQQLLNCADSGMYKAKAQGKNQRLRLGKPA